MVWWAMHVRVWVSSIVLDDGASMMINIVDRYRITEGVNLPFRVLPTIKELGRTRMEVNVKVCNQQ